MLHLIMQSEINIYIRNKLCNMLLMHLNNAYFELELNLKLVYIDLLTNDVSA